jgi:alkaline phosphatase
LASILLTFVVLMFIATFGELDVSLGPLNLRSRDIGDDEIQRQTTAGRDAGVEAAMALAESAPAAEPSTRRVVLIIGDGLGLGGLTSASILIHGPEGGLAVESLPVVGLVRTTSANNLITDSAAAGTAMSTGTKTHRGVVGQLPDGTKLSNLLEAARAAGLATGVVTTSSIGDATPSSFTVHGPSRRDRVELFAKMLGAGCDVLIGAHWDLLEEPPIRRALERVRERGTTIVYDEEALRRASGSVVALFPRRQGQEQAGGPPLEVSTRAALRILSHDGEGFVLVVESEETDLAGHHNDSERLQEAVRELDAAVRAVLDFAESNPDTLVVATADHDTGGPAIVSGSPDSHAEAEVRWLVDSHVANWVPLFATGPGAERFSGVMDNTEIGSRLASLLGLEGLGEPLVGDQ